MQQQNKKLSDLDLIKMLESDNTLEEGVKTEVDFGSISLFLEKFNILPGDNAVSVLTVYKLYKTWARLNAINHHMFYKQIQDFIPCKNEGPKTICLIDTKLSVLHEQLKEESTIIVNRNTKIMQFITDRKIDNGNIYVDIYCVYLSYIKFAKRRVDIDIFEKTLMREFEYKKRYNKSTNSLIITLKINRDFRAEMTEEELRSYDKSRIENYEKKRKKYNKIKKT